jgi:hypothetical protein
MPWQGSMRNRFPRTAAHCFTEMFNREMNVPAGLCIRKTVDGRDFAAPRRRDRMPKEAKKTHERANEQLAAFGRRIAVIVTRSAPQSRTRFFR